MGMSSARENLVIMLTDPEVNAAFKRMVRKEVQAILRGELPAAIKQQQPQRSAPVVPPGYWNMDKAVVMTGYSRSALHHGVSLGYYGGKAGLLVISDLVEHVFKNAPHRIRTQLRINLEREQQGHAVLPTTPQPERAPVPEPATLF